jgi:DNA-directed RNA polymerase specialized sigma24 family protein
MADPREAEDILQDVFFSFVQAYRLPAPIEQVGAWLFQVARNRIIDRSRKKRANRQLLPGAVRIGAAPLAVTMQQRMK